MQRGTLDDIPGVGAEIASSIERTLREESRRNELAIAWVRGVAMAVFAAVEVVYAVGDNNVPLPWRAPAFVYLVLAWALVAVLRRGWYHPALPTVTLFGDWAYMLLRMEVTFRFNPIDGLERVMELATVVALACVLVVSGVFRLSRSAAFTTTALALLLYGRFVSYTHLGTPQIVVHLVLIGSVGAMGLALTSLVRRAVQSEVASLTLRRLLPARVLERAQSDPVALLTRPRSVDATVLVTDLRGFTSWAETRTPIEVLAFLNEVQGSLAEVVRKNGGTVDKFMGDGMLAVFGAPDELRDHAERAVEAARQMQSVMSRVGQGIRLGVGVHSGDLVVGCLGSGPRMEFTILGDTVNTASRLESLTKETGTDVLVSESVVRRIPHVDGLTSIGMLPIRGRREGIEAFTVD